MRTGIRGRIVERMFTDQFLIISVNYSKIYRYVKLAATWCCYCTGSSPLYFESGKGTRGVFVAKYEKTINGDFDDLLHRIENGILSGSMSASLEESSDFRDGDAQCSVRVFERYSYAGGNRLSMSVTLFQSGSQTIHLSAITSGGSQAMFFKINTWGEDAFLDKIKEIL